MNNQTKQFLEIEALKAENERLKAELEHGKRLANKLLDKNEALEAEKFQSILDMLYVLDQSGGKDNSILMFADCSGFLLDEERVEICEFENREQLFEIANGYISEYNKLK